MKRTNDTGAWAPKGARSTGTVMAIAPCRRPVPSGYVPGCEVAPAVLRLAPSNQSRQSQHPLLQSLAPSTDNGLMTADTPSSGSILVTGAAGFIGFHVARRLLEQGRSVVGVDSLSAYYDPALKQARLAELKPYP